MPLFSWLDSYSVNSNAIDEQHKKLISLINYLQDNLNTGYSNEVLAKTLDALIDYARVHFADEENLMTDVKYPHLNIHQAQHDLFVRKVFELQADFRAGRSDLALPVLEFLKDWLANHIIKADKQYAEYIKSKDSEQKPDNS